MYRDRVRLPSLLDKVMSAAETADLIQDGVTVGMSGFIHAGEARAVPQALAMRAKERPLRISLMTGASLGNSLSRQLTEAGVLARRMSFQVDSTLRKVVSAGEVMLIGQRLSEAVEQSRNHQLRLPDIAAIEAAAITKQGHTVPTTSVGNPMSFAVFAKQAIVEIDPAHNANLEGLHDTYTPTYWPTYTPIPLTHVDDRIGSMAIPVLPGKIAAIVISGQPDLPSTVPPLDGETQAITNYLINFFERGVDAGCMSNSLGSLQAGIGSITNAVIYDLIEPPFENLTMYPEVLQDSTFGLIDAGKLHLASGGPITLSPRRNANVFGDLERYKDKLVLRPQEISNHSEMVHRLDIIDINAALEFDIYGSVNSTHVDGTKMMSGIGGSDDFARDAHLAIFATESIAKGGNAPGVMPMVGHVGHIGHDADIPVTEQSFAGLRGLTLRERTRVTIENCVHLSYQAPLLDYFEAVHAEDGHMPHLLYEALA